jgi:predicted transcriptional regulator
VKDVLFNMLWRKKMGIFDDLVQGVTKEVSKVQARSQEMLQVYNLQSQIRELERKKTGKLLEIGKLAVDKYHHNKEVTDEVVKDKVNEVAGFDHEISLLQTELDSLRVQADPDAPASKKSESKAGFKTSPGYECPSCHAPASRDKQFCPTCGASMKRDDADVVDVEPNGDSN